MAWTAKFNFRSTSGFSGVTDGADEIYVISDTGTLNDPGEDYSVSRAPAINGTPTVTFGWNTNTATTTRDRDSSNDRRLAGMHSNAGATTATFRVDLPSAGVYSIRIAAGDAGAAYSPLKFDVLDNGTPTAIAVNSSTASGDKYLDATGTEYSDVNWISSNTAVSVTFSSTVFQLRIGDGSSTQTGAVAHLVIDQVSVGSSSTKPLWPMSFF